MFTHYSRKPVEGLGFVIFLDMDNDKLLYTAAIHVPSSFTTGKDPYYTELAKWEYEEFPLREQRVLDTHWTIDADVLDRHLAYPTTRVHVVSERDKLTDISVEFVDPQGRLEGVLSLPLPDRAAYDAALVLMHNVQRADSWSELLWALNLFYTQVAAQQEGR